MTIRSSEDASIDYGDRVFHVEVMRGGMNRLLLRSYPNDQLRSRVEILFMNVRFMNMGTDFDGLVISDRGHLSDQPGSLSWRVSPQPELHVFEIESASGTGVIVAGAVAVDESDAATGDPSHFFMMD